MYYLDASMPPPAAPDEAPASPLDLAPDPVGKYRPAVYQCQVQKDPNSERHCNQQWDRKHTVLGFAICEECWEACRG